jgi:hypothetical protein
MIKSVTTSTPAYITTSHYGGVGYMSGHSNTGAVGMTRYNPSSANMEVWDGSTWLSISASTDVSLTPDTIQLLEWARRERDRQLRYEAMARDNVTIADALESVKDAELRLRELAILCDDTGRL